MTTDVELCKEIVFKYADEPCFPTKIQFEDLVRLFPDRRPDELQFNLIALDEAGLLSVTHQSEASFDGPYVLIGTIYGLTPYKGSEFVRHARSTKRWKEKVAECSKLYGDVMLGRMIDLLISSLQ